MTQLEERYYTKVMRKMALSKQVCYSSLIINQEVGDALPPFSFSLPSPSLHPLSSSFPFHLLPLKIPLSTSSLSFPIFSSLHPEEALYV